MNGEHKRTVRLPHGYRATFVARANPAFFEVLWEPAPPAIKSKRAWRKFFAAYTTARDDFLKDVATMLGGTVLVADVGGDLGGVTTIEPEVRH